MEKIFFDDNQDAIHLSMGISDERAEEILNSIKEHMDKYMKDNTDVEGAVHFNGAKVVEPMLAMALNQQELMFCAFKAGAVTQFHKMNKDMFTKEEVAGIVENLLDGNVQVVSL